MPQKHKCHMDKFLTSNYNCGCPQDMSSTPPPQSSHRICPHQPHPPSLFISQPQSNNHQPGKIRKNQFVNFHLVLCVSMHVNCYVCCLTSWDVPLFCWVRGYWGKHPAHIRRRGGVPAINTHHLRYRADGNVLLLSWFWKQ